ATRSKDQGRAVVNSARLASWMFWLFFIFALAAAVIAPWLVRVLLGTGYEGAVPATQLLVFGLPAAAIAKVIYPVLAGTGKPYFGTPVIVLSLIVGVA